MLQLITVVCMTLLDATLSERFWQALLQLHSNFSLPAWSSQQSHKVIARHHFAAVLMPCIHTGEFICLGGTDGKATLCTQNGTVLSTLADRGSWVWCVRGHPKKNCVAVGCQDGSIAVYQLLFSTVHGLYSDLYAYRLTLNYLLYEMTCVTSLLRGSWYNSSTSLLMQLVSGNVCCLAQTWSLSCCTGLVVQLRTCVLCLLALCCHALQLVTCIALCIYIVVAQGAYDRCGDTEPDYRRADAHCM